MRDGPEMKVPLDKQIPGLRDLLFDIIASGASTAGRRPKPDRNVADNDLRRHYIEIYGKTVEYERSLAVHEHIDVFMDKIMPKLFAFYQQNGRSMREDVMIICAYNYAVSRTPSTNQ